MKNTDTGFCHNKKSALLAAVVLLFLPALLILLNAAKLHFPTAQWDDLVLKSIRAIGAGTFSQAPYLIHTPLYLYLLEIFQPLYAADLLAGARLFNFACYLLTGWLVFGLSRRLAPEGFKPAAGLLGAALYFTSPLAVQGASLLDLGDTSLVPLAAAAYCYALTFGVSGALKGALLVAVFALNLWSKLIHSFFFILAALADSLVNRKDALPLKRLGLIGAGIVVFAVTWTVYSFAALEPGDRWKPMEYFFNNMLLNYQKQQFSESLREIALTKFINTFRIMLWLWPPLALWGVRVLKRGLGSGLERYFNCVMLLFLAATVISKSTSNGFPKYHAVALPLLCALGGAYAAEALAGLERRRLLPGAAAAAVAGWLLVFFAGDPFYTFNHGFKEAVIGGGGVSGPAWRLMFELVSALAAALLLLHAARRAFGSRASEVFSLLAAGLVWQTAVGYRQARSDYFTTCGYGTRGKTDTVEYLKANMKRGVVFCPNEFRWELGEAGVGFMDVNDFCQMKKECVLGSLRDRKTGAFVFGQASNTVAQVASFLGFTEEKLGRKFSVAKKGDFWVYIFDDTVK